MTYNYNMQLPLQKPAKYMNSIDASWADIVIEHQISNRICRRRGGKAREIRVCASVEEKLA